MKSGEPIGIRPVANGFIVEVMGCSPTAELRAMSDVMVFETMEGMCRFLGRHFPAVTGEVSIAPPPGVHPAGPLPHHALGDAVMRAALMKTDRVLACGEV